MTIKKKVEIKEFIDDEKSRLDFISKGAAVKADKEKSGEYKDILIRVPNFILEHIAKDIEKKPWMNRTQWILDAVAAKIDQESK